jgi:hypothetical protein
MTLGSHQTSIGKTQVHITPRWIIEVLGPFDLDPAAADPRPWDCARVNYTERDNGLAQQWFGRTWLRGAVVLQVKVNLKSRLIVLLFVYGFRTHYQRRFSA